MNGIKGRGAHKLLSVQKLGTTLTTSEGIEGGKRKGDLVDETMNGSLSP